MYLYTCMEMPQVFWISSSCWVGSWVAGGILVKALDCGSKGPGFQSHLQQRFISLLGALSPTSKIEYKVFLRVLRRGR